MNNYRNGEQLLILIETVYFYMTNVAGHVFNKSQSYCALRGMSAGTFLAVRIIIKY